MRMARIGKAVYERGTVLTCPRLLRSEWRGDARRLVITPSTSTLCLQHSRNGGGWHNRRRPGDQLYEPAEVLCDRCQRELELGPARPAGAVDTAGRVRAAKLQGKVPKTGAVGKRTGARPT